LECHCNIEGDESAKAALQELVSEADATREKMMFKLRALASNGDERAKAMLVELSQEASS
jgi:hypothetical protein